MIKRIIENCGNYVKNYRESDNGRLSSPLLANMVSFIVLYYKYILLAKG